MTDLNRDTVFHAPAFVTRQAGKGTIVLDPEAPNWIVTDERGVRLLNHFDGCKSFSAVVSAYASEMREDIARAWLHVDTFARDALRQGFLATDTVKTSPYLGRAAYLQLEKLEEIWLHINDFCNLRCEHCLVSSGPEEGQGLPFDVLERVIEESVTLGARRFFFTGGEPLARPDAVDLLALVTHKYERDAVLMTNGTLFEGKQFQQLLNLPLDKLKVQISLDGARAEINDSIRGSGTFQRIVKGIQFAVEAGLAPTMTMTLLRHNLSNVNAMVRLAGDLGVSNIHLLWPHRRGRLLNGPFANLPSALELLEVVRQAVPVAEKLGIAIDNVEEFQLRLDGPAGIKRDLAGAGWNSLCVNADGNVYPSASMAGVPDLNCGTIVNQSLQEIWRNSVVCQNLRSVTVEQKSHCQNCDLKFLCGGGDLEHGYWASLEDSNCENSFAAHDPYCELYKGLASDAFARWSDEGRLSVQSLSGFDRPLVQRAMGQQTFGNVEQVAVTTTHSSCVLSEEVIDKSRSMVRDFYSDAARYPQTELCCPIRPNEADLAHIPPEVVERFYGCGSPVSAAALQSGEVMVDLGSGAGIDCFIAAKKVGSHGKVFGVDMTPEMLAVARECAPQVAERLGFNCVEFRQGYLERIPIGINTADVVTSNCVINLSPDKPRVLREIWRILKDHGRAVIADIVADKTVPPQMQGNGQLWGECISGALTEEVFLAEFERAGFYGISVLEKSLWREVEGYKFYSVTVVGYKFQKKAGCQYLGQYAIYLGPMKATIDEEGHLFPRGVPIEVCADTVEKLSHAPYAGKFAVVKGQGPSFVVNEDSTCCDSSDECC